MTTMHFLSDRYGRRIAMFTLWFILALVSARPEYLPRIYVSNPDACVSHRLAVGHDRISSFSALALVDR